MIFVSTKQITCHFKIYYGKIFSLTFFNKGHLKNEKFTFILCWCFIFFPLHATGVFQLEMNACSGYDFDI